jgi:hypothetical protein
MRIWSLHPQHLDTKGLVALWRETLLAKQVLEGKTKGYKHHPQLVRFRQIDKPADAIHYYLEIVWAEANKRHYQFDESKFTAVSSLPQIPVTKGQVEYETQHLLNKLHARDYNAYLRNKAYGDMKLHPLFYLIEGDIESWEKSSV